MLDTGQIKVDLIFWNCNTCCCEYCPCNESNVGGLCKPVVVSFKFHENNNLFIIINIIIPSKASL